MSASSLQRSLALCQAGRLSEAEQILVEVLRLEPANSEALHLRGIVAARTGREALAVDLFSQALFSKPQDPGLLLNRGIALKSLGRFEEALRDLGNVTALAPDVADAYAAQAAVLRTLRRSDEALASIDRALRLQPGSASAHNIRGNVLSDLERFRDALASYDRAIELQPDLAEAYSNRGAALREFGMSEASLDACDTAIRLQPNRAAYHINRGNTLRDLGQFEAALASYDRAIALDPDEAVTYRNRAAVLTDLRRFEAALENFRRAIAMQPEVPELYKNLAMCCLAMGDYEQGWELYEWRWHAKTALPRAELPGHPWLGDSPIDGKTILVHEEGGFGDSLQFCRYVPLLAQRATVIVDVPRPLVRLLSSLQGGPRVIATGSRVPPVDAWVPMQSLPLAFGTRLQTIPGTVPYLHPDPKQAAAWRQRLAGLPGRKVGLVWAGNARAHNPHAHATDRRRSITLQHYAPLAAVPGVCLVSLQKGDPADQARSPPAGMVLHDWTGELDDFADTAALVDALDLVISVDTAVAHVAGALGKPVWVLSRYDQCWRWLHGRTDSPWYPSVRLFQQAVLGDWAGVIREVVAALAEAV